MHDVKIIYKKTTFNLQLLQVRLFPSRPMTSPECVRPGTSKTSGENTCLCLHFCCQTCGFQPSGQFHV